MLAPVAYRGAEYEGILDWFKRLFGGPTIEDLPPEQRARIQQMVKSAQMRGLILGAVAGVAVAYVFLKSGQKQKQPTATATAR